MNAVGIVLIVVGAVVIHWAVGRAATNSTPKTPTVTGPSGTD